MIWKVQLSCQYRAVSSLHFNVQMWCPTGVLTRHKRQKRKTPFGIRKLMPPQSVTSVVGHWNDFVLAGSESILPFHYKGAQAVKF